MNASDSVTIRNTESAFAGESMAHIKYLYFAKLCRAQGDEETAKVFKDTAAQKVQQAFGHRGRDLRAHRDVPSFQHMAGEEDRHDAVAEMDEHIEESREHAERFDALTRVEELHANHYPETLKRIAS